MSELTPLPCPFCGQAVEYVYYAGNNWHCMVHRDAINQCPLHVGCYDEDVSPEAFVAWWNQRPCLSLDPAIRLQQLEVLTEQAQRELATPSAPKTQP